jgi:hypothetical protein
MEDARKKGWVVISIKDDWNRIFGFDRSMGYCGHEPIRPDRASGESLKSSPYGPWRLIRRRLVR